MSRENGRGWQSWLSLITVAISTLALLGAGTVLVDEVWRARELTCAVLPKYDLGNEFLTGLVVENRSRATLTDVRIAISDLEAPMLSDPFVPGSHGLAMLVEGGQGHTGAQVEIAQLSKGESLSVYILTREEVTLEESRTFSVSAKETSGAEASHGTSLADVGIGALVGIGLLVVLCTAILIESVQGVLTGRGNYRVDRLTEGEPKSEWKP
jgi:hypothetical protein